MKTMWLCFGMIGLAGGFAWAGSSSRTTCGDSGPKIEDRIRDCANFESQMKLVRVTLRGYKINMDDTGLLWGDYRNEGVCGSQEACLSGEMNWEDALKACEVLTEAEGNLLGVKWNLPTADELAHIGSKDQRTYNKWEKKSIEGTELWTELPNMPDRFFWSSSRTGYSNKMWAFRGKGGDVGYYHRDDFLSVRCVGRPFSPATDQHGTSPGVD